MVNQLAATRASVSLADPVAIYINKFSRGSFKLDPAGDQSILLPIPEGTFVFERGDIAKGQALRLKIQIPDGYINAEGRQLTVSDIYDTKNLTSIRYGSQFADYILVGVTGVAITGGTPAEAKFCPDAGGSHGGTLLGYRPTLIGRKKQENSALYSCAGS